MTPKLVTRSFSNDQFYVDSVFFQNYYKLKGEKNSKRVVVDIGAHIGSFTFTALLLGCSKVYAFEPHIDSFAVLLENTYNNHFVGRITPYQVGVYTEKTLGLFSTPEFINDIYFDFASVGLVSKDKNYYPCSCVTLDDILETYCYGESIDVLKINIGYAEKEILLNSVVLTKNVKSICGEAEFSDEMDLLNFRKELGVKGFMQWHSLPVNSAGRVQFWCSKKELNTDFSIII